MNSLKSKHLFAESLESRELLAVTAGSEITLPEPAEAGFWLVNTAADPDTWDTADTEISLREALSSASSGDTIGFASSLTGSTITLSGTALTVSSAVAISAESIDGITISGGGASAVFYIDGTSAGGTVTMTRLNIIGGETTDHGGGIENNEGTLILEECTFTGNTANFGGALFNHFGNTTLINCTITENQSALYGGGIYNHYGTLTISGSTVSGNSAHNGGGIYNESGSVTVSDSEISLNYASYIGGGVDSFYGNISLISCRILDNCSRDGGGIYTNTAEIELINTLIAGNSVETEGGAIGNFWGTVSLENCTVAGNSAETAGGIWASTSSVTILYNTICAGNIGDDIQINGTAEIECYSSMSSFTDWTASSSPFVYSVTKPLFTDIAQYDFTLAAESQAIDIGTNSYVTADADLAGNERIINGIVDLGAYEYTPEPEPLDVPEILNGSAQYRISAGANRHHLVWRAVENADVYKVSWSADGTTWKSLLISNTEFTIKGLTYGKTIQYRVCAVGDGILFSSSDWSAVKSFAVCPMDIDEDGFIGPGDTSILSYSWLASSGDANWLLCADINGDGYVGPEDKSYLSINWFALLDESSTIVYPPAADAIFSEQDEIFSSIAF